MWNCVSMYNLLIIREGRMSQRQYDRVSSCYIACRWSQIQVTIQTRFWDYHIIAIIVRVLCYQLIPDVVAMPLCVSWRRPSADVLWRCYWCRCNSWASRGCVRTCRWTCMYAVAYVQCVCYVFFITVYGRLCSLCSAIFTSDWYSVMHPRRWSRVRLNQCRRSNLLQIYDSHSCNLEWPLAAASFFYHSWHKNCCKCVAEWR